MPDDTNRHRITGQIRQVGHRNDVTWLMAIGQAEKVANLDKCVVPSDRVNFERLQKWAKILADNGDRAIYVVTRMHSGEFL